MLIFIDQKECFAWQQVVVTRDAYVFTLPTNEKAEKKSTDIAKLFYFSLLGTETNASKILLMRTKTMRKENIVLEFWLGQWRA